MIALGVRAVLRFRTLLIVIVVITAIIDGSLPGWGDNSPTEGKPAKPFGIDQRVPLTTSKVVGSPDPPPPYRVRRLFPNLKINFPIAVVRQPDTDLLQFITE